MTAAKSGSSPVRQWLPALRPTRDEAVDLAGAFLLTCLAVVGFRTVFHGPNYLLASFPAAAAGAALGHVAARRRWPGVVTAAAAIVGYFVIGTPLAMRSLSPAGLVDLLDGSVNGWARLLTTLPPAGQEGNLLAPPYLCAYAAALSSVLLARRLIRWHVCVAPPLVAVAASVLFGIDRPAALALQGALFTVVTIGWMSLRDARSRRVVVHTSTARRRVGPVVLLGVAAAGAFLVGPSLPLADTRPRYVLREVVEPPFDPRTYPSPLAAFRTFRREEAKETIYLTATGLPKGAHVRVAVLDDYDGTVWRATGKGGTTAGTYDRVGEVIPQDDEGAGVDGQRASVRLTVGAQRGVWLPGVGEPTGVRFSGPRAPGLLDALRFDRRTDVGAVPGLALTEGDVIALETVYQPAPSAKDLAAVPIDPTAVLPLPPGIDDAMRTLASDRTAAAATPYAKAEALEAWLREGYYSDGGRDATPVVPPGHSLGRLAQLLDPKRHMAGNAEQYSAAMAVLARSLGLPARVVVGFDPKAEGGAVAVTGDDASAWVEIAFAGKGWVAFDPTPDESRTPPLEPVTPPTNPLPADVDVPTPTTVPVLEDSGPDEGESSAPGASSAACPPPPSPEGRGLLAAMLRVLAYVSLPAGLIVAPFALVVGLKARRRRRRRSSGSPATRVAAGWAEVVDLARDVGRPVPRRATRVEVAGALEATGIAGVGGLAGTADELVFGRTEPSEDAALAFWSQVDGTIDAALSPLRRRDRVRASVSVASLRGPR